jgi:hypothetical protein
MPLARYFFLVGAVLLALLFASDAYLPKPAVADRTRIDLPVIRIHSIRKWPERVVYDTSLPTIIADQIAKSDANVSAPPTVIDALAKTEVREALAQLPPSDAKKVEPRQHQRKIAKHRALPPMFLAARHPQYGWYGYW